MIQELKQALPKVTDSDKAWKQINYFTNNQERMDYARYRAAGWPIGSGLVEGQCRRRSALQGQRHEMASTRQPLRATHPSGAAQRRPEELLQPA